MKTLSLLAAALFEGRRRPGMNVLRIASAVQDGETLTFGSVVFEVDTNTPSQVTAGRVRVDLSGSGTAAAAARVGTFAANAADTETITIAGVVYTFKTATPAAANEVLIGADLTASRNNLVAAITAAAGAGTTYGTGTVENPSVTATPSSTNALTVTAKTKGTAGNSIAIAEASAQFSWASAATTLTGGVDPTGAEFTTALETAANAVGNIKATRISATEVLFENWRADTFAKPLACTETLAGTNNGWGQATTYGHFSPNEEAPPALTIVSVTPKAWEVTSGTLHILLDFQPANWIVQVVTTAGVVKAWDGAAIRTGKRLTLDNTGSVDWAATDKITVFASQ